MTTAHLSLLIIIVPATAAVRRVPPSLLRMPWRREHRGAATLEGSGQPYSMRLLGAGLGPQSKEEDDTVIMFERDKTNESEKEEKKNEEAATRESMHTVIP